MQYFARFYDFVMEIVVALMVNVWSAFLYVLLLAFVANIGYKLRHKNIYHLTGGSLTLVVLWGLITGHHIVDSIWYNRLLGACGVLFIIQFFTIVDKFASLSDGIDEKQMARVERLVGSAFIRTTLRVSVDNPIFGWAIRLFVFLFGFVPKEKMRAAWQARKKSE